MRRRMYFVGFVLAVLAVYSCAADTNQTAALAFLATISGPVTPIQPAVAVATNKPAWESSLSAGFSLTKGNSDTLLTTGAFRTRKRTEKNEFMFGVDGA